MYVLVGRALRVVDKKVARREKIHHTMMHGGGNLTAAGELVVRADGHIALDNNSGHYKTPNRCMTYARRLIQASYGLTYVKTVDQRMSAYMKRTLVFRRGSQAS